MPDLDQKSYVTTEFAAHAAVVDATRKAIVEPLGRLVELSAAAIGQGGSTGGHSCVTSRSSADQSISPGSGSPRIDDLAQAVGGGKREA